MSYTFIFRKKFVITLIGIFFTNNSLKFLSIFVHWLQSIIYIFKSWFFQDFLFIVFNTIMHINCYFSIFIFIFIVHFFFFISLCINAKHNEFMQNSKLVFRPIFTILNLYPRDQWRCQFNHQIPCCFLQTLIHYSTNFTKS